MRDDDTKTEDYEAPKVEELGTVEDYTEALGISIIIDI